MNEVKVLIEEIQKSLEALDRLDAFYDRVALDPDRERNQELALIVADILGKYYTCTETIFLRISQHFENGLGADRWHTDLLSKMRLQIAGTREPAISDETHDILLELMKFRHFTRYYFDLRYDWDRLDYLMKKLAQVRPMLRSDLKSFTTFLDSLDAI